MSDKVYDYYYENYLMLYSLYGRGRPRVSREKYEDLDKELLALIAKLRPEDMPETAEDGSKTDVKTVAENPARAAESLAALNRMREIEFILLDDIAEALLDNKAPKATKKQIESTIMPQVPASTPAPSGDIE